MDAAGKKKLQTVKAELNAVIRELESLSGSVRSDFEGIGNDKCADAMEDVLKQCYTVRGKLNAIDTGRLVKG